MTEEQIRELTGTLRAAIVEEIENRIGRVIAVVEHVDEMDRRAYSVEKRLERAVLALVDADGALATRLARAESVLKTIAVPTNGLTETHEAAKKTYPPAVETLERAAPKEPRTKWYWMGWRATGPKGRDPS